MALLIVLNWKRHKHPSIKVGYRCELRTMLIYIANCRRFYKKNLGQGKKKESTKF